MPDPLRHRMEVAFAADFSGVRVHEGHQATHVVALAYTQGQDIHFAPGAYDPHSRAGQELLSHELAHVVQQRTPGTPDVPCGMVDVERPGGTSEGP